MRKIQKVKVSEIDNAIREEIGKIKKAEQLRQRLSEIDQTLSELESVDEVSVGGRKSGKEFYEKNVPVAKFEKKGSHLKEEEGDEEELASTAGSFEEKFAEIGRELDSMLAGEEEEIDDLEDLEDLESDESSEEDLEIVDDSDEEDLEDSEEEEEDEEMEVELEEEMDEEETLEEQDGEAIVNAAPQDTVNKNMKKVDNKNPMADKLYEEDQIEEVEIIDEEEECEDEEEMMEEEEAINESTKNTKKVIKEQTEKKVFNDASPLLMEELERMKKLARL